MLGELIDADRSLLSKTFCDMPFGNIELLGATLLHCAVEFGEIECIGALLTRPAHINVRLDIKGGRGGHTPLAHAAFKGLSLRFPGILRTERRRSRAGSLASDMASG